MATTTKTELKQLLDQASVAYAKGSPVMTDLRFDELQREWETLTGETYVWEDPAGDVQHSRPMLSLHKSHEQPDISKHMKRVLKGAVQVPKIDGLAAAITYGLSQWDGLDLVEALTRGKRVGGLTYGNRVTGNVKKMDCIPKQLDNGDLNFKGFKTRMEIRGEIYLPEELFLQAQALRAKQGKTPFENVRNAAAGILRNEDGEGLHLLRFVAYNAFNPDVPAHEDKTFSKYTQVLAWLTEFGFETTPYREVTIEECTVESMHEFLDNLTLPYQTDGVVIMANNMDEVRSLGTNNSHPLYATAFKFEDETAETELLNIEWAATRTGRIVPTYVFAEVRLEGTNVTRATGHNLANLVKIGALRGDIVEVYKANMIIPQVKRLVKANNPDFSRVWGVTNCPECKHEVESNDVDLLCPNAGCPAKLVLQLVNACNRKNWDIDGMGESVAEALVEAGLIKNLADLFILDPKLMAAMPFGEKSVYGVSRSKTLSEQIAKAKTRPWAVTLHALGCPGLGEPECREISKRFGLVDLISNTSEHQLRLAIRQSPPEDQAIAFARADVNPAYDFITDLTGIKGMGKKTAETLYDWLKSNKTWLATMLLTSGLRIDKEETPELESTKFEGKTFVVTGTHQVPRHVIEKLITDNGGTISGSVSKKTDYLVAGADAGSKLAKAEEVNAKAKTDEDKVGIITLGELRLLIE